MGGQISVLRNSGHGKAHEHYEVASGFDCLKRERIRVRIDYVSLVVCHEGVVGFSSILDRHSEIFQRNLKSSAGRILALCSAIVEETHRIDDGRFDAATRTD